MFYYFYYFFYFFFFFFFWGGLLHGRRHLKAMLPWGLGVGSHHVGRPENPIPLIKDYTLNYRGPYNTMI